MKAVKDRLCSCKNATNIEEIVLTFIVVFHEIFLIDLSLIYFLIASQIVVWVKLPNIVWNTNYTKPASPDYKKLEKELVKTVGTFQVEAIFFSNR